MTDLELGLDRMQFRAIGARGGAVAVPSARHDARVGDWATLIELGSEQEPTGQVATVEILGARPLGDGQLLEVAFSPVQWRHELDLEVDATAPPITKEGAA